MNSLKEHILWSGLLLVDGIIAFILLVNPLSLEFNRFGPDIIGSFLGIFGAVALEESIRTFRFNSQMEKNLDSLLDEAMELAREFAGGTLYVVLNSRWKSLRSTRFVEYIPEDHLHWFEKLDRYVVHHNDLAKQLFLVVSRTHEKLHMRKRFLAAEERKELDNMLEVIHEWDKRGYEVCQHILCVLYPNPLRESTMKEIHGVYESRKDNQ